MSMTMTIGYKTADEYIVSVLYKGARLAESRKFRTYDEAMGYAKSVENVDKMKVFACMGKNLAVSIPETDWTA